MPWANESTNDGRTSYESQTLSVMLCMFIETTKTPSIKSGHHDVVHRTEVINVGT